jgi:hypothetical protein
MSTSGPFQELNETQRQTYQAAVELYQAYLEALQQGRRFKGGMHWKKIRGREYLYRYRDRYGHGDSLGPRSEHTEQLFGDFSRERQEALDRLQTQRLRLQEQARFCRAALIHRVPRPVAKILRRLEQDELGQNLLVISTTAVYAYEFAAGVFLPGFARGDLLNEAHRRLILAGEGKSSWDDLLRLLRQADRSFAPVPGEGCRAVNRDGFLVRLLKSEVRRPGRQKPVTVSGAREPLPPEAGQFQSLLTAPRFTQVVIGADGGPATLVVPDPWAFALNKLWWSQQEDREEGRRARDRRQALAVADLVLRYLPQYDFSSSELEMFPRELAGQTQGFGGGSDFPEDVTMEY